MIIKEDLNSLLENLKVLKEIEEEEEKKEEEEGSNEKESSLSKFDKEVSKDMESQKDEVMADAVSEIEDSEASSVDFELDKYFQKYQQSHMESSGSDNFSSANPSVQDGLNLDGFAQSIVNLIENLENLVPLDELIVHRAESFLEKNYGMDAKKTFSESLEKMNFKFEKDKEDVYTGIDTPYAVGASGGEGGGGLA